MIQRLIDSLRVLAAPVEEGPVLPGDVVRAEELALEFDDAFTLIRDCPQLMLTSRQQDALVDLDLTLTALGGLAGSRPWTAQALRENPEWQVVRRQAAAALDALTAAH